MSEKTTIVKAIKTVMNEAGKPLSAREVYQRILDGKLYTFHAQIPESVVLSQIRRHCKGIDFPSAAPTKHFRITSDGKYEPLPSTHELIISNICLLKPEPEDILTSTLQQLKQMQIQYLSLVKNRILQELKQLTPEAFEKFARKLLEIYGFIDVKVTQISNDGGIDGYGRLKVGIAYMKVAFQCKKWSRASIQRPEIDKFRGAIQGEYEQGLFFTTSKFSSGAQAVSIKPGAVPVILIDGQSIVDLMIEKLFGVEQETINIYSYALDLVLANDE